MQLHPVELDHIVLVVADVERSLAFYCGTLGLEPVRVDEWRAGDAPFPSARISAGTIIDVFPAAAGAPAGRNLDHFCICVAPGDVDAIVASGELAIVEGPVPRFGARGVATSVYVHDPDGNTVELREYPMR